MSDDRRRHTRATPGDNQRVSDKPGGTLVRNSLSPAGQRPVAPSKPARACYCEIDGLPVELDLNELHSAGMFIVTPQPAVLDSEVEVFVRIGELRFEATGHVVKTVSCDAAAKSGKKPGYALLFTNLPEAERQRLTDAVRSLQPQQPSARGDEESTGTMRAAELLRQSLPSPKYDRAELELLQYLDKELEQLTGQPAWTVLGVSQGADAAELKTAFFQASKRYHPHLFARYAHPDIKRVVTALFIAHKRAYTHMLKLGKSMRASRP